jgi:DNA-directed RNA polymerase specialized sigma24 family protein
MAKVVELHVFGGFAIPEIAGLLALTERTVFRDWRKARAFLVERLG